MFSNPDLISISKQADGDWLLTSLAPFTSDETLTITMMDGAKFIVGVKDEQESADLTNFLTNVVIIGAVLDANGKYVVEANKPYSLKLEFAESSSYQFDNDADLIYQLPQGIKVLTAQSGSMTNNIEYRGMTYPVDATYSLDTYGSIIEHDGQR